jgi:hypothetical protein
MEKKKRRKMKNEEYSKMPRLAEWRVGPVL